MLYQSLKTGSGAHPVGSAAVKELYDTAGNLTGYAIDVKDPADGQWVFYERFAPNFTSGYYYRSTGNLCSNCHSSGRDMVLVPASAFP